MKQIMLPLFLVGVLHSQADEALPSARQAQSNFVSYAVAERGPNHRVWEQTTYETGPDGEQTPVVRSYTELATGMHYQNEGGEWLESRAEIEILPNGAGAAATHGQHKAIFPPNIYNGQIELNTPDNKWLRSQVIGLSYFDTASGQSVMIAEVTNSVGELAASNVVIYPNAFTDFSVDIRYTYARAGFEQDIILRQQPPSPAEYGLNPETTRLQVLTEFFSPPTPGIHERTIQGLTDESLDFGVMKIGAGKAFALGDDSIAGQGQALRHQVRVAKEWLQMEGRNFLVEEVEFKKVEPKLQELLPAPLAMKRKPAFPTSILHRVVAGRALPAPRLVKQGTNTFQLAKTKALSKPGYVLDYQTLSGATDFTFRGDTTYYVSSEVVLSGTTTFEGGAVIKANESALIVINSGGTITNKTGPYRPAIFTSKNDNSVGETISGSSGTPAYTDVASYLSLQSDATLSYLRFNYARYWSVDAGSQDLYVWNCQFINATYAILAYGDTLRLYNVLLNQRADYDEGIIIFESNGDLLAENVTAGNCADLVETFGMSPTINFVNTINTRGNEVWISGGNWMTATNPIFQAVGAGKYYLANNSPYRNTGTNAVSTVLLAELKKKTTYPPLICTNTTISISTNWGPQAQRDTNTLDFGYHYDPLDYLVSEVTVSAPVTLTNGVAVGVYGNKGFKYGSGGPLVSEGTPSSPNRIAWYPTVQEGALGSKSGTNAYLVVTGATATAASASFRFTHFHVVASSGRYHLQTGNKGSGDPVPTISLRDCELYGGNILSTLAVGHHIFNNCLFDRVINYFDAGELPWDLTVEARNCFFRGGTFTLYGDGPERHVFRDNFFQMPGITGGGITSSHNAFTNSYGFGGPNEKTNVVVDFQSGPLGYYYYPTSGAGLFLLQNQGSTNANALGLYHFTMHTNQTKEANSVVDIGYHYVAVHTNGNPIDTDGGGGPDYIEDRNGNGVIDTGETSWTNSFRSVNITSPINNTIFFAPTNLTISMTVSNNESWVAQVQVFSGQMLIGIATNSPYTVIWSSATVGTNALTAVATDALGVSTTSSVVSVIIDNVDFVKGINLNGSAVTIEGNLWLSYAQALAAGLSVTNAQTNSATYSFPLSPNTDLDTTNMLRSWIEGRRVPSLAAQSNHMTTFQWEFDLLKTNSFMRIMLSNVLSGYVLTNSANNFTYPGWCVSLHEGVDTQIKYPCLLYYTYDQPSKRYAATNFNMVNYILNHRHGTMEDVQNAIWSVLGQGTYTGTDCPIWSHDYVTNSNFLIMTNEARTLGVNFIPSTNQSALTLLDPGGTLQPICVEINQSNAPTAAAVKFSLNQTLTNNNYYVYFWMAENQTNHARSLDFKVQGTTVTTNAGDLMWGEWAKYGPYAANVTNGILTVDVVSPIKGNPMLMGMTIYAHTTLTTNAALTIRINDPTNGQTYAISPTNIVLSATPSKIFTNAFGVEFFAGTTSLGFASDIVQGTNYTFDWRPVMGGTYQLTARGTNIDGLNATSAVVTITVNRQPLVRITTPTNGTQIFNPGTNLTVTADASDSDGSVASVQFFLGTNTLGVDATSTYSVNWTNIQPGTYTLVARATDNLGATTNSRTVTVTVTANNHPPLVSAGSNQTIYLPETANLVGAATDDHLPYGSQLSIHWSKLSGPGLVSFGNSNLPLTTASFTSPGTYELTLSANDSVYFVSNSVTITVETNLPPLVYPGTNRVAIGRDALALYGVAVDDGQPTNGVLLCTWSLASGPAPVTFANANQTNTVVSFGQEGLYELRLTATDGQLTTSSNITVFVGSLNPLPYGAANYLYILPSSPAEYQSLSNVFYTDAFDESACLVGDAPFGNENAGCMGCPLNQYTIIKTYWPGGAFGRRHLLARRHFTLSAGVTNFEIGCALDNNARFYINGTLITNKARVSAFPGEYHYWTPENDNWYEQSLCAQYDSFIITDLPGSLLREGDNVLAVDADDPDCLSFIDVRVTPNPYDVEGSNQPPILSISGEQFVTMGNVANLTGIIVDDGLPGTTNHLAKWAVVGGPTNYAQFFPSTKEFKTIAAFQTVVTFATNGTYVMRLTASDGEFVVSNDVTVVVADALAAPPIVNLIAPSNNASFPANSIIPLTATASTTNGTITKVEFLASIYGGYGVIGRMTTSPYSLDFIWPDPGQYALLARATDSSGRVGYSSFVYLNITTNHVPVARRDDFVVLANSAYNALYPLANDTDQDGNDLIITSITHPNDTNSIAAIINSGRAIKFVPAPYTYTGEGFDYFYYTVSDGKGGTATSVVTVQIKGSLPLEVQITNPPNDTVVHAGDPLTMYASVAPANFQGKVDFVVNNVTLGTVTNPPYNFTWTAIEDSCECGIYAVATDIYKQIGVSQPLRLTIEPPTNGILGGPMARIDNITNVVTQVNGQPYATIPVIRDGLFNLRGAAYATNGSLTNTSYLIQVLTIDGTVLKELTPLPQDAYGFHYGTVGSLSTTGLLATLDFTTLLNGVYDLQLVVRAGYEQTGTAVRFALENNLKIGQFSFSQQDLVIPVNGIPLTVTRTYNSLNQKSADFGSGWTYAVNDVSMQLDEDREETEYLFNDDDADYVGGGETFSLRVGGGRDVTLTLPDGRRTTFYYYLLPVQCNPGDAVNLCQEPTWLADPDVHYTLTLADDVKLVNLFGFSFWTDDASSSPDNYEFKKFILTDQEGTKFQIDRADLGSYVFLGGDTRSNYAHVYGEAKVSKITQRSGDTITITPSSMVHKNPQGVTTRQVKFDRDPAGRVVAIYDPNSLDGSGNPTGPAAVKYEYAGENLVNVLHLQDRSVPGTPVYLTTTYEYTNASYPHYITAIIDPRGIPVAKTFYDDSGRIIGTEDADGKKTQIFHDVDGRVEVVVDRLGRTNSFAYDIRGNVTAMTNALNGITLMAYDEHNNKTSEIAYLDGLPYATNSYRFNTNGWLTGSTDPLGHTNGLAYNSHGQMELSFDAFGRGTTNTYDGSTGNLLTSVDTLGNPTTYAYDASSRLTSSTDAAGTVTANYYDGSGNLTGTKTSGASGAILGTNSFAYDANGNCTNSTVWRLVGGSWTGATTTNFYDGQNRLTHTVEPDGGTNRVVYNAIGKQQATIDKLGRATSYEYDDQGRLFRTSYTNQTTESFGYDSEGRRTSSVDRAGRTTTYVYDALGRLTQTIFPDDASTRTVYDDLGRAKFTVDARGTTNAFGYDAAGRRMSVTNAYLNAVQMVSSYGYDANGNQLYFTNALSRTTNVYDALNRVVQVRYTDGTKTSTAYDTVGRRVAETNQDNIPTLFGYDGMGRLTSVTNALLKVTRYEYDEAGNQTAQTDALGRTNRFAYDGLGRRLTHAMPDPTMVEKFGYDLLGNLIRHTNFNGKVITNQYDVMNRLITRSSGGGYKITYTYTTTDQRETMSDPESPYSYIYDLRDRLVNVSGPVSVNDYGYDANGNLTNLQVQVVAETPEVQVSYRYDALNRLTNVADAHIGGNTSYGFDGVGNLRQVRYPNGVTNLYQYDSLSRLTNAVWKLNTTVLGDFSYRLGLAGQRTNLSETVSGVSRAYRWSYDPLYRLTNETITGTAPTGVVGYAYDDVGNRTNRGSSLAGIGNQTPAFNPNDWLRTDAYDTNGNTLWSTNGTAAGPYQYDAENRLTNFNNGAVSLFYDGDGRLVKRVAGGVTTYYVTDDRNPSGYLQVLAELTEEWEVERAYTYGLDLISQRVPGESTNYYGYDGHGSTRFLVNEVGTVTATYMYDAYGTLVNSTGSVTNDYLFCGERLDPYLSKYDLRARLLNPDTGRFWTHDTHEGNNEDPLSLHKYLYCHDNPANRIDPTGNTDFIQTVATMGIQLTVQTLNATRGAAALVAARALPFTSGGAAFMANYGQRALQYLQSMGPRGVHVLQTAFQRSTEVVTRSQALQSPNWNSPSAMREALNQIVNNGSRANPANIQWHHIIEQTRGIQQFGANAINSLANIIPTPTAIHQTISAFYSSSPGFVRALGNFSRVRDYVSSLSWEQQYRIGLEIWQHAMSTGGKMDPQTLQQIVSRL